MRIKLPKRDLESHKGDNGKVLAVAGSVDYPGAAYLSASAVAALRCGADIVKVAAPGKVAWAINSLNPDIITIKLEGKALGIRHHPRIKALMNDCDVLLIGNGIGTSRGTSALARKLIYEDPDIPKVIDADALKAIDLHKVRNAILIPHQMEYEILLSNSGITEGRLQDAIGYNIILLKGKTDSIISKERTTKNRTGCSGMTVGGTGDILAGLCAGFLSQGCSLFDSARYAAFLNGKIGEKLQKTLGNGLIASDFLKVVAEVVKKYS